MHGLHGCGRGSKGYHGCICRQNPRVRRVSIITNLFPWIYLVLLGFIWTELAARLYLPGPERREPFPLSNGRGSGSGFPSSGGLKPATFSRREKGSATRARARRRSRPSSGSCRRARYLVVEVIRGMMQRRAVPLPTKRNAPGRRLEHEGEAPPNPWSRARSHRHGVRRDFARNAGGESVAPRRLTVGG